MNGTVIAQAQARLTHSLSRLGDSPNTVIAALVLSTCVTALAGYAVVSKALPHVMRQTPVADVAAADVPARPVPRPGARVRPLLAPADPAVIALGFADPGVERRAPEALEPQDRADAPQTLLYMPVRVVEGRPAIVPPRRPAAQDTGILRLARGMTPARALGLPLPVARPEDAATAAPVAVAAARSLRPTLRPATLSTRAPRAQVVEVVLAAATTPEAEPRPRLSDPVPPRAGANPCSSGLTRAIPRRPGSAAGGSAVMAAVGNGSGSGRDNALVAEALRGNVPGYLRDLQPVRFTGMVGGRQTEITICVTPDYLAIGSDADHVRVPLGLPAALRVADAFDMMLPTTRMVDAIYAQADVRVSPSPMTPGSTMSSTDYFLRHDATVDAQFANAGARHGLLVAGHKKDVVLSNRLSRAPGRVAIYGWHRANGNPIQPLSTVHGEYYADYSHGIRLVARTAYVNGRAVDLRGLLTDGQYAGLLNSEGPLTGATVRLAALQ
jgi:hypothetical protein